jgi:aspartate/methionine/tyrosine aminotransferase
VFPNITGLGLGDSVTVQERILREAGVAALSGTAFGAGGEGYLRLSYANSLKNLQTAMTRIREWAHAAQQGRLAAAAGSITSGDR